MSLRALLTESQVVLPGVFNAITAQQAVACGHPALYLSGAGLTNALTGYPDIALLTLTEFAQQARYVCRAVPGTPVIADADTGFGDVLNVARTVEEYEHAGLAGLHLEDQLSPKRCGHLDGKSLIEPEAMAAKIRAAVRARTNPDFFLIARTDARGVTGLDDAIARAKCYVDSGADAIFPEGLQSREEFEAFASALPGTYLLANMTEFGKTPMISAEEFALLGYRLVIFPMTAFRAMLYTAREVYTTLHKTGTQQSLLGQMQTRAELYELIGYKKYTEFDNEVSTSPPSPSPGRSYLTEKGGTSSTTPLSSPAKNERPGEGGAGGGRG